MKIDNCEECGEPIQRVGTSLWCVNGCYEDDIRNFFSEDEMEAGQMGHITFPPDLRAEDELQRKSHYDPCRNCGGEDCVCCSFGRGM